MTDKDLSRDAVDSMFSTLGYEEGTGGDFMVNESAPERNFPQIATPQPRARSPLPASLFKQTFTPPPDIKHVPINESIVADLVKDLNEEDELIPTPKSTPKIVEKPKQVEPVKVSLEEKAQSLVTQFSKLLIEANKIIQEMTSCGMIGTKQAKPLNKKVLPKKLTYKR